MSETWILVSEPLSVSLFGLELKTIPQFNIASHFHNLENPSQSLYRRWEKLKNFKKFLTPFSLLARILNQIRIENHSPFQIYAGHSQPKSYTQVERIWIFYHILITSIKSLAKSRHLDKGSYLSKLTVYSQFRGPCLVYNQLR